MSDVLRILYVVGLGTNLGDRLAVLRSAVLALGPYGHVRRLSHVYETPALGPPQPDYLNAAVLFDSGLPPRELLDELLRIEQRHGRERRERWGPRTLDLDLLLSPGLTLEVPGLRLPHPELVRRPFALVPLLDVLPDACDEVSGASYAELLAKLDPMPVRRVEISEGWDPRSRAG
ncbi:MAG TPA: 2-amino-4-hydroxy-6-hydroxymethyldihydropteridine diphosphokinase [Polyangiaceae bacterium]|nr:2-amino-4-hydroxy-6-hydroxymethyldihydropteridine diphosphokinase [Polyangiaceae bacterium]